ncbi:hypothetical protein GCM10007094_21810 [Pseudovibrio japonicus]|uniref:Uncharacterized protein n=1 Tax=Pseudovibrio japonicus TaxID=366534 RepID=A0ABQ3ED21_9HYPH|nr:hypothetical protein [Pseudovibrio japonicus]GHB32559.1 hypothetical protein GCM10007094_21810 [Pseudovibrio japonicus]
MLPLAKRIAVLGTVFATTLGASALITHAAQINARAAGYSQTGQLVSFGLYNNAIITDDLTLQRLNSDYVFLSADPSDPFDLVSGSCFGGAVIKNMKVQGGGVCSLKDKDGDPFALSYEITEINEGKYTGTWTVLGGDGAWANAKGHGTWNRTILPNMTLSVTTVQGEITF